MRSIAFSVITLIADEELYLWYGWPAKDGYPYFQPEPLSEILTTAYLRLAASRVWTCVKPEFRLSWMKLCSSDNHYATAPSNKNMSWSFCIYLLLIWHVSLRKKVSSLQRNSPLTQLDCFNHQVHKQLPEMFCIKKVFLKILQISKESTCVGVSFY